MVRYHKIVYAYTKEIEMDLYGECCECGKYTLIMYCDSTFQNFRCAECGDFDESEAVVKEARRLWREANTQEG